MTLDNMFSIQSEMRDLKPARLILDLTGVSYLDSAGLEVLMNYYVSAENNHRKLLIAGVNERVMALLEMTKGDKILKTYETVEAAQATGLA